jgi:hypothetical protein
MSDEPLALPAATAQPCHGGIGAGLVNEEQPGRAKQSLRAFPQQTCPSDVRPSLFAGTQAFF